MGEVAKSVNYFYAAHTVWARLVIIWACDVMVIDYIGCVGGVSDRLIIFAHACIGSKPRQKLLLLCLVLSRIAMAGTIEGCEEGWIEGYGYIYCLLYTSDAADE